MRNKPANPDQVIARIAARQHGVVGIAQLSEAGIERVGASRRAASGRLHRVHRGVYAVGHARLGFEGRCFAAVLACAGAPRASEAAHWGAVVSHRSAAALWDLLPEHAGAIELTVSGDGGRDRRSGLAIHRSRSLLADVSTRRNGIPVTNPTRTLRDLKRAHGVALAHRAFRRALDLRLVGPDALGPEPDFTRSKLERRFVALCRRHRLPPPEVNACVGPYEVDFLWRREMVIVETDSWQHHGHRVAFESDRAKDARLQALGYRILRFTWRQIEADPRLVAGSLRAVLRSSGEGAA